MTFLPIIMVAKMIKLKAINLKKLTSAIKTELCINHYQILHGDALEVCEHNWDFILIVLFVALKATKIGIVLIFWPSSS